MKSSEILFESNCGVIFEKSATKNRCKVTVKNKDSGYTHMTYRYKNGVESLSSQYISWENLNCCGGWTYDESYLLTAVQEGKKLCSGNTFNNQNDLNCYIDSLPTEYPHFCRSPMHNGPHTFYYADVVRAGAIRDYIDTDSIFRTYEKLGLLNFNTNALLKLLSIPMIRLISDVFNYGNPKNPEEIITTGLLLGYPLESTAWLLEKYY